MRLLILQKRKFAVKKRHNLITRVQITVLISSFKKLKVARINCRERAKDKLSREETVAKVARRLLPATVSSSKVLQDRIRS